MLAREHLHLGEDVTAVLGELARTVTAPGAVHGGHAQLGLGQDRLDPAVEVLTQGGGQHGDPLLGQAGEQGIVGEELVHIGPHVEQGLLHAAVGLLGALAQTQGPLGGVVLVVLDLLERLVRDGGQGLVLRLHQTAVQLVLVVGEDQLLDDRLGEVAVLLLHQTAGAELVLVTEVGQIILGLAPGGAGVGQEEPRVAEQVQPDVAQGDVLLQLRCTGDPPAQALGQHQGVVTQVQRVVRHILRGRDPGRADLLGGDGDAGALLGGGVMGCEAHRCFTPSLLV